jgi:hypothetical protein
MDPQNNPGPAIGMPPLPSGEAHSTNPLPTQVGGQVQSASVSPADPGSAWLPPSVPVQPTTSPAPNGGPSVSVSVPTPDIADDGDIIEKEWVMKAKEIVARTRQDPHLQTKELHKFKAEYMKKRYNKTIQPVEE